MCGLAGVMGHNLGIGEIQKFKDLFLLAQLRGDDGAGMIASPKKSHVANVKVKRTTWSSGHLITTSEFDDCVKGDQNILIGHARQPTRGGSKIENVHPHRCNNIILVHNGTMTYINDAQIPAGESDSKIITRTIAEKGPQHFVNSSWGAYALVWIDLDKQTLNFLKNNERTLWMCEEKITTMSDKPRYLWWASEGWMLHTIMSRYVGYNKDRFNFFAMPNDEHWSYPLDVTHQLAAPTVEKCVRKNFSVTTYHGDQDWEEWVGGSGTKKGEHSAPFVAGAGDKNATTSGTPGNANGFRYTPPEYRNTGTDRSPGTSPIVQAGAILLRSKNDALLNSASIDKIKKESVSQSAIIFPDADQEPRDLDYYTVKEVKRITDMVAHAGCVWCSNKPLFIRKDGETKPPRIFAVRFTQTRGEYVCEDCVKDIDVQRMVGIAS